jgi:hypothetical protein
VSADLVVIVDQLREQRSQHARIVVGLDQAISALESTLTSEEKSALWLRDFDGVEVVASGRDAGQRSEGDSEGRGETAPASSPAVHPEPDESDPTDPASAARRPEATQHSPGCWLDRGAGADGASTAPVDEVQVEAEYTSADELADAAPAPEPVPVALAEGIDYAEVARVAREAFDDDRPMRNAVAEHFRITASAAGMRIRIARSKGHQVPDGRTAPRSGATAAKPDSIVATLRGAPRALVSPVIPAGAKVVLQCDDCDLPFAPDRYLDLRDHVTMEHNRKVRDSERTPRTRSEAS